MPAPSSPATSQLSSLFSEALSGLSSASSRSGSVSPLLSSPTPVDSRHRRSESVSSRAVAKSEISEVEEHVAACAHVAPPLSAARLADLAKQFADAIPDEGFSVAALQGYLLKNKSRPEAAAEGAPAWVIAERELRERLKKEREAKEREIEKEEKEEEEEERAAEADKEKAKAADDSVVEPVNDENAAPASADSSKAAAEKANADGASDASDSKSADTPSDAGVTWVQLTENTAEAETESS